MDQPREHIEHTPAYLAIWRWADKIDSAYGRAKVIAFAFALLASILALAWLLALRSLGVTGIIVLVICVTSFLLAGGLGLSLRKSMRASSADDRAAPVERFPLHGIELKEAWHFRDERGDPLGDDFMVVEMRYTNKEPEKVNLNAEGYYQIVRYGQTLGKGSKLFHRSGNPLRDQLKFPLEVEPRSTTVGLLVFHVDSIAFDFFDNHGIAPRWETTTTLVLEEYVSSSSREFSIPFADRSTREHENAMSAIRDLIDEGQRLYGARADGEDRFERWMRDHGAWRERIKTDLPSADYIQALALEGIEDKDATVRLYNVEPAKVRVERILKNLRALHDEYHKGLR